MAYKTQKTDQEWEKIRAQNSLGPQIGGLIHDAVALQVAFLNKITDSEWNVDNVDEIRKMTKDNIEYWLDTLYEIAENKKAEITTPKPVDLTKAEELGDKWKKDRIEEERIRIGAKYQEKEEEIPILEET